MPKICGKCEYYSDKCKDLSNKNFGKYRNYNDRCSGYLAGGKAQKAWFKKLIAERDSLKEQLQTAQKVIENRNFIVTRMTEIIKRHRDTLIGYEQQLKKYRELNIKIEADKAEAVRVAVKQVLLECNLCGFIDPDICKQCEQFKNKSDLERITGKKWEEMRG